jgi:hypothetical protein
MPTFGEELNSDAQIVASPQETILSNAHIITTGTKQVTIGSDAMIKASVSVGINSQAWMERFTAPIRIFPLDDEDYNLFDDDERVRFGIPYDVNSEPVHVHIQLATDAAFTNVIFDFMSWQEPSRWAYFNGSTYVQWPDEGVPFVGQGGEGRFKIQGPVAEQLINRGKWYWRIRGVRK